jgi:hypothetical protein
MQNIPQKTQTINDLFDNINFNVYDYPIGGKMVVAKYALPIYYATLAETDAAVREQIKTSLLQQTIDHILQNKLCEFTQMRSIDGQTTVACRLYLAPNDQIKILRVANKI